MAREMTEKERMYADAFLEIGVKSEAYRRAYNADGMTAKTISNEACKVHGRKRIQDYIAARQKELRDRHGVTLDTITKELDAARDFAMEQRNPSAVVQAITAKARMHGLYDKALDDDTTASFQVHISGVSKKKSDRSAAVNNFS